MPCSEAVMADAPLSETARKDFLRLSQETKDYFPGLSSEEKKAKLARISYAKFLTEIVGVDPQVVKVYQAAPHPLFGVGIDAVPSQDAWGLGLPGFAGMLNFCWRRLSAFVIDIQHFRTQKRPLLIHFEHLETTLPLRHDIQFAIRMFFRDRQNFRSAANLRHTFVLRANNAERSLLSEAFTNHFFVPRLEDMKWKRYSRQKHSFEWE